MRPSLQEAALFITPFGLSRACLYVETVCAKHACICTATKLRAKFHNLPDHFYTPSPAICYTRCSIDFLRLFFLNSLFALFSSYFHVVECSLSWTTVEFSAHKWRIQREYRGRSADHPFRRAEICLVCLNMLSPDQQSGIFCLIICAIQLLTANTLGGN